MPKYDHAHVKYLLPDASAMRELEVGLTPADVAEYEALEEKRAGWYEWEAWIKPRAESFGMPAGALIMQFYLAG